MKGIIIVGCGHLMTAIDLQAAMSAANIEMPVIMIEHPVLHQEEAKEKMMEELKLVPMPESPDLTNYHDYSKQGFQPRFKFNNVRKIRT